MSKPEIHAASSARRFGGKPEDYMPIHQLMDSSKGAIADNRHRALTHNSWFIQPDGCLELIFGTAITNSDGKQVAVRSIGEQHILEDFNGRFIPTVQDYLGEMEMKPWMNNAMGGAVAPSSKRLFEKESEVPKFDPHTVRLD